MKAFFELIITFFKSLFNKKTENVIIEGDSVDEVADDTQVFTADTADNKAEELIEDDNDTDIAIEDVIASSLSKSKVKILIDNGHGDNTPGKRSPFSCYGTLPEIPFFEYKWNREIAEPLVERLKDLGYDAELIVPEITDISLGERVRRVNNICSKLGAGNVILVSVHANAAGNGKEWLSGRGWSAYTTKGTTKSDIFAEYLYKAAEKNFVGKKLRKDMSDGDSDQEANFYIIKNTNCPAVLTENFFYDNVEDVKYILSEEGREAVIQTHIDGIIDFIKYLGK